MAGKSTVYNVGDRIGIGDNIVVRIVEASRCRVRLEIEAPRTEAIGVIPWPPAAERSGPCPAIPLTFGRSRGKDTA